MQTLDWKIITSKSHLQFFGANQWNLKRNNQIYEKFVNENKSYFRRVNIFQAMTP